MTRHSRNASRTLRSRRTRPTGLSECAHTAPPGTAETPQGDTPAGDSGPLRPAPLLISAGAASCHHPDRSLSLTPRPWSTIPSPPSGSHRAPSSLPDLLLPPPPQSTSGMAVGGAFPELSPGFSRSWLSPLQPLLQVPTPLASCFLSTPTRSHLRPSCPDHRAAPRRHRRGPCSPTSAHGTSPGLASAVFHSWH